MFTCWQCKSTLFSGQMTCGHCGSEQHTAPQSNYRRVSPRKRRVMEGRGGNAPHDPGSLRNQFRDFRGAGKLLHSADGSQGNRGSEKTGAAGVRCARSRPITAGIYQSSADLSRRLFSRWVQPVDGSALAVFRIAFGLLMLWEAWRYLNRGWVERHIYAAKLHFTYWPFDFVAPLPGEGMYVVLILMGLFGFCVALGVCYRTTSVLLFLAVSYIFLVEKALYLNHFYLICVFAGILAVVPAHRCFSVDALLSKGKGWPSTVPYWAWWLILFQIAVPMTYGGLAKLNRDWLRGEPLGTWLAERASYPLIGPFVESDAFVWDMVYGAIVIDLFFLAYILPRRTRVFGYGILLAFHFLNALLFSIGVFPWMMILATLCFFGPSWPRKVWRDCRLRNRSALTRLVIGAVSGGIVAGLWPTGGQWGAVVIPHVLVGMIGVGAFAYFLSEPFESRRQSTPRADLAAVTQGASIPIYAAFLVAYVAFQLLVPLRHYVIPGNVHRTEEGHDFSWHMKLRDKEALSAIYVATGDGARYLVNPFEHLTPEQLSSFPTRPDMIWQYARFLETEAKKRGMTGISVYADVKVSLNGRDFQPFVDRNEALNRAPRPKPLWGHINWVWPLGNGRG